jgi:DNA repair exonuclease SbcCD ATPase subunit
MMTDEGQFPLEVEQIECAQLGQAKITIRVTGRWRGRRRMPDSRAFLVVDTDGRRHRFPAMLEPRRRRLVRQSSWGASFALPARFERQLENVSLWFGDVEVELPAISFRSASSPDGEPALREIPAEEPDAAVPAPVPEEDLPAVETVAALRAGLQQRAAIAAQLRAELATTKAELDQRVAHQAELDSTQAELRAELERLLALIEQDGAERILLEARTRELAEQLESLRAELAQSEVARDATSGESAGLQAEVDRLGAELAHARRAEPAGAGLLEARSLLVEAKAATARLRERSERVPEV